MVFRVPVPRCLAFSASWSATRFGFLHLAQRSTTRSYGEIHKRVAKLLYDGLPLGFNRGYVLMELILNGLNCGYADGTGWSRR